MCLHKILCYFNIHKYEETTHLSRPYNITPYRRVRNIMMQCTRCCNIKEGKPYYGLVTSKPSEKIPYKQCKVKI